MIEQLERDTARLAAAYDVDQPQSARRVRDHRHRVSRSIAIAPASCSASPARPATPTAASRPSTTCSRASSATSILLVGLGRVVQDFLLWCTMEFGYLRLGEGFVQSSSIMPQKRNPGRARARARHRQQGRRPGAGHRHRRPQHALRRHRRHRRRSAAARRVDVSRRDAHGDAGGGDDARRRFRCRRGSPRGPVSAGRR